MSEYSAHYYNRAGKSITLWQWLEASKEFGKKRVLATRVGPWWISTVWLGLDHQFDLYGPPLIFETMVFARGRVTFNDNDCERYSTEAEARQGHRRFVLRYWLYLLTFRWLSGFRWKLK